jgi:hypothetical protein
MRSALARGAALALLTVGCYTPTTAAPSPSTPTAAVTSASSTATPSPSAVGGATPTTAAGGVEVWATGALRGTVAWVVREEFVEQDRVTESLYAVPIDGSPARLVVRRSRARRAMPIVPLRQLSPDGTQLALEQSPTGPAAHDGFVVIDLVSGRIRELARGDSREDVMPAWSPDGKRIAYARRNPGSTPVARDDGLWVIGADGTGAVRVLGAAPQARTTYVFGWTADGGAIAHGLGFEGVTYALVDLATGTITEPKGFSLGLAPASWRLKTPQFAGALSQGDKGGEQMLQVADGVGRPARTIVSGQWDLAAGGPTFHNARWNPIADEILYISSARQAKIYRVAPTGGAPTEVPLSGQPFRAEWLPDGRIAVITIANGIGGQLQILDGARQTVVFSFPQSGANLTDFAVRP